MIEVNWYNVSMDDNLMEAVCLIYKNNILEKLLLHYKLIHWNIRRQNEYLI